jgi:hypothetical protein
MTRAPPRSLAGGAQRGADTLDLVLALEQRGRPGKRGLLHAPIDRKAAHTAHAMFGGRCQGMCPMCRAPVGPTMAGTKTRHDKEDAMRLKQVKIIEGVFTAPQEQEVIDAKAPALASTGPSS